MAKGFTVKAKSPVAAQAKKAPEWDFDKAKELIKGKSIVFCLERMVKNLQTKV